MTDDQYGYEDATTDAARASQAKLAGKVRDQARLLAKTQERAKAHKVKLDRMVAQVVSSKPEREDWYAHPGVLHRDAVLEATGLSTVALHRLMERYRATAPKPKRRRKS